MRVLLLTVAVVALYARTASAQDFVGTRALSLSEAYRATATGNDAIYFNPAGLNVIPRDGIELSYRGDLSDKQDHSVDVSVVDSKTSPMALGIAYTFDGREFTKRASYQHKATLALSYPVFPKTLNIGAGLKYVNVSDAILGNYLNALSADVGALITIPGGITVAAVGYNLIPIKSQREALSAGFAANLDLGPLSALIFGGGPSLGFKPNAAGLPSPTTLGDLQGPLSGLTLEADWQLNFATLYGTKSRFSGGLEYLFLESIPLRGGYLYDELTNDHFVSVGAGFIVPYFGLDVAYQQSLKHSNERVFSMALKFFLSL